MTFKIVHREQSAEELAAWEAWTDFTDKAEVAPDTVRDAEALANCYYRKTGRLTTAEAVEALMPENHPDYPWNR